MSSDVRYQILIDGEADPDLTAEAIEITVTQTIEGPTTFSIRFATDVCDGDVAFMDDERVKPSGADTLLSVIIVIDGRSFCIARHRNAPAGKLRRRGTGFVARNHGHRSPRADGPRAQRRRSHRQGQ